MLEYPWNETNITFTWLNCLYNPFKVLQNSPEKTCVGLSCLIKLQALVLDRCFLKNFAKFLITFFFLQNTFSHLNKEVQHWLEEQIS